MLGYIFIILGVYATYSYWSDNLTMAIIAGLATLVAIITQYLVVSKNKFGVANDDKNLLLVNMGSSVAILLLFIISFFVK